jgi:hypothetical protein
MKVKAELNLTVEMGGVSHDNTGCQGYMPEGTAYADLVRVFGEPQINSSPDGKIKAEWIGKINGLVFTIYDYKSKVEPEQNTDWHIGGKIKLSAELVNLYFKAHQ